MITKVWLKLNLFKLTLWKKFILTWGNFWWFIGMMYILLYSSMWLCPEWYYTFSNEQKYSFIEHDLHQITYAVASKRPLKWTEQFLPRRSGKPAIADHFCFTQSHFLWQSLKKLKVAKKICIYSWQSQLDGRLTPLKRSHVRQSWKRNLL